jgi:hypothetical protein
MRGRVLLALLLASTGATVACGPAATSKPTQQTTAKGALSTHHTTAADGAVVLRDATGAPILQGSTTPYSPEKTCGECHDVSVITRGYHFQQGRTDATNQIVISDSFNPTKPWLLSSGMYGKT